MKDKKEIYNEIKNICINNLTTNITGKKEIINNIKCTNKILKIVNLQHDCQFSHYYKLISDIVDNNDTTFIFNIKISNPLNKFLHMLAIIKTCTEHIYLYNNKNNIITIINTINNYLNDDNFINMIINDNEYIEYEILYLEQINNNDIISNKKMIKYSKKFILPVVIFCGIGTLIYFIRK